LPNEYGVPNHAPDGVAVDNHHIMTGSNEQGLLYQNDPSFTCQDWTSSVGSAGTPHCGLSWPRSAYVGGLPIQMPGDHWIASYSAPGCAAGVNLVETGAAPFGTDYVGAGGGYGGIYCFALTP
jgi:hypothetical protein